MRICFVLVDRANLRLLPVLRAVNSQFDTHVICGGTMPLQRFGCSADLVRQEGFQVSEVWQESDGGEHINMALGCGYGVSAYANELKRLKPDLLICIGDRFELLGAATAAHLMNVPIMHFQGGETSGCVDDRTRHAITQLATWHVPATRLAAESIERMTGRKDSIVTVGCPSSDLAAEVACDDEAEGPLMSIFHPNTTGDGTDRNQMTELLAALASVPHAAELWWPNIDAGNEAIHKAIRTFRAKPRNWLTTVKNLEPTEFLHRLANTRCAVGNSSSFVRDAGFFGTPVVLVGGRQQGREYGENVIHVPAERNAIAEALKAQLEHGRYDVDDTYGDGRVSERVVEWLTKKAGLVGAV